jgi:SH3-like domain-containing protein
VPDPRNPSRARPERPFRSIALLVLALALGDLPAGAVRADTGLPLPRFVSLRSAEVNLRTGPGNTYPIDWVYKRRHMPVEVIAEFDNWRKIRDWQGAVGWVHQNLLDGRRYALITAEQLLLSRPAADAAPVARLMPGVIAALVACEPEWCRLEIDGREGWLARDGIWGVYPTESFD